MNRVPRLRMAGLSALIVPPMDSTKPRADRKPQPCPRRAAVAFDAPVELVENLVEILGWDTLALIGDADGNFRTILPCIDGNRTISRIFRGIVEKVEQDLAEQGQHRR